MKRLKGSDIAFDYLFSAKEPAMGVIIRRHPDTNNRNIINPKIKIFVNCILSDFK